MSKKQNSKKKPEDYPLFNMRLSRADKDKYVKFAKEYNLKLAGLVRKGLQVIYNNPAFLNDLEDPYLAKVKDSIEESKNYTENIEKELFAIKEEIKEINKMIYLIAAKQEIQLNGKDDDSSKAVFE